MISTSLRHFLRRWFFQRLFLIALVFLANLSLSLPGSGDAFGLQAPQSPTEKAIAESTRFLISQQADDGGWHSQHYGSMKQGAANTALVLYALSQLPPDQVQAHADSIDRAREFLIQGIKKKGCVANPEGSLDYPVYGTALILTAHNRIDLKLTSKQIQTMVQYLLDCQCMEPRGFTAENPNHGGWDILGTGSTQGKTSGANTSVTFYVVEALSQFRPSVNKETKNDPPSVARDSKGELPERLEKAVESALVAAQQWCHRIVDSSKDGGFYFTSKQKSMLNKAGWQDEQMNHPSAYGSATCDGLSLLMRLNAGQTNQRAKASIGWLANHPGVEAVPGFGKEVDSIGWPSSLRFYYAAALSRSLSVFEKDQAKLTRNAIVKQLTQTQLSSGAWCNESSHMRENDELIATSFGLIALLNCKPGGAAK